jgi:hypothetical protein
MDSEFAASPVFLYILPYPDTDISSTAPPTPPLTPVPIEWRGPATSVFLIRAGDEDWMGRREMIREGE